MKNILLIALSFLTISSPALSEDLKVNGGIRTFSLKECFAYQNYTQPSGSIEIICTLPTGQYLHIDNLGTVALTRVLPL